MSQIGDASHRTQILIAVIAALGGIAVAIIGLFGTLAVTNRTITSTSPSPNVTATVTEPGPTITRDVPGPTVTVVAPSGGESSGPSSDGVKPTWQMARRNQTTYWSAAG